jgi:hypothetical protein
MISIDWPSKQLLGQALTIDNDTTVTLTVSNVNDILYVYDVSITSQPMPPPGVLSAYGPAPMAAGAKDPCADPEVKIQAIQDAWTKSWQLNPWISTDNKTKLTTPASISLLTTIAFYQQGIQQPLTQLNQQFPAACVDVTVRGQLQALLAQSAAWDAKIGMSHTFTLKNQVLSPLNNYTVHIDEYAADAAHAPTLTTACTDSSKKATECQIQYQPQTNIVSVSGGFLFSELSSRTYSRQNVPGGTDAVLAVNGNSMSSLLASLVNVKLPCVKWSCDIPKSQYGVAVSIGPVLSLKGTTGVSQVGLFSGLSLSMWNYLYVSAGAHIGQFADYPSGFTHPGQDIPSSFTAALTPVGRTTARFAFGVTFKGFSIPTGSKTSQGTLTATGNTK